MNLTLDLFGGDKLFLSWTFCGEGKVEEKMARTMDAAAERPMCKRTKSESLLANKVFVALFKLYTNII
jgi:hypothetical protein